MGIPNLWQELSPAASTTTLPSYCLSCFTSNSNSSRGLRLGIDASLWLFHAQQSSGGSNPYLRLLFYRLAKLLTLPVLPLFVFDGPERPAWKRGKQVKGKQHAIEHPFTQLIEAFGFQWCRARGEAEAELAWLNTQGVVDAVLTDDSDALLFGAKVVVRNWGRNLSGTKAFSRTNSTSSDVFEDIPSNSTGPQLTGSDRDHLITFYKASDLLTHPDLGLDTDGLILIALMSGGDYDTTGLLNCGVKIALALARGGFGSWLVSAFKSSYPTLSSASASQPCPRFTSFLTTWLEDVREELRTNSRGHLPNRRPKLASTVRDTFLATVESRRVLTCYVYPLTSAGKEAEVRGKGGEPDLEQLASLAQQYFQWSKEAILGKFRRVLGPGVVVRRLRQEIVELVDGGGVEGPWGSLVDSPGSKALRRFRLGLDVNPREESASGVKDKGGNGGKKPMHESPNATRITDFFSRTGLTSPPSPPSPSSRPTPSSTSISPSATRPAPTLKIEVIKLQRRHASLVPFLDYRVLVPMEEFTLTTERGVDPQLDAEFRTNRIQEQESDTELDKELTTTKVERVDDSKEPLLMWIPEPLLELSVSGGEKLKAFKSEVEKKAAGKIKKANATGKGDSGGGGGRKGQMSLIAFVQPGAKASISSKNPTGIGKKATIIDRGEEPVTPRTTRQVRIPSGLLRRTESLPPPPPLGLGRKRGMHKVHSTPITAETDEIEGDSSIEFLGSFISSHKQSSVHSRPVTPASDSSFETNRVQKSPRNPRQETPSQRALAEPAFDQEGTEGEKELIPPSPTQLFGKLLPSISKGINQNAKRKGRISAITISDDSNPE